MSVLKVEALDYSNEKSNNSSWSDWGEKIKTYTGKEIVSTGSTWNAGGDSDTKIGAVKADCKNFLEGSSRSYDSDFEIKYQIAVTWCGK